MLRLDKVIKPWRESAALNDHINLYGFWNETAFLTKSGDLGVVLSVPGVDYESLDRSEQEYAVKRLEAALKAFGPGFHVYQYLFKSNRPDIPFATYDDPVVAAAIDQRRKFFEAKRDHLYQIEIVYCILLEGARSKTGVGTALARLLRDPEGAIAELKSQFTNDNMKKLLRTHIERDLQRLDQHVQAFARQLADFMQIEVLNRQGQFTFFRRLLNYDDWRIAGRPTSTQFLDYQVVNSDIEAERDHLRVGDHIIRVLTMKEAITETRPLVLDALLKIPGNFYVVTEWTPLPANKARKEVNKRRRHFNMSKTGFVSQNQGGEGRRIPPPASIRGRIERGIADLSGIGLHDLPETRAEVEEIGKIVGLDAVMLFGKDATETGFKKQPLDQFRILHLAVHGFADTQYPERSALVLGTDPQSGDDGLLQVREIIRLRLNAELTTLSSCDSGVGKLQGQEGISNLVEAFLVAGSRSVVASLWSADDTFASALMEQFYRHLAQGDDTSSALRNAKLDLLAKYGDQVSPFYWASFIAVGETSKPIGIRQQ